MAPRKFCWLLLSPLLTGCQITYYAHTGYNQSQLLLQRQPISEVLKDPKLSKEHAEKIKLAQDAKNFSIEHFGLKATKSYDTYVNLNRDAVTYVVQVAYSDRLEHYNWWYPFVGKMPYKGFFREDLARSEAESFPPDKYDTLVRGVRAYSTLGWFDDPLTSPMLQYNSQDLVETIIHELTHTTLFIKSQADFNERLATFVGVEGSKQYFLNREGPDSQTKKAIERDQADLQVVSQFLSAELPELKKWYEVQAKSFSAEKKSLRIKELQEKFAIQIKPKLKGPTFKNFSEQTLNNATLLSYQTYISDLKVFDQLLRKLNGDLKRFIQEVKKLESSDQPEMDLSRLTTGL